MLRLAAAERLLVLAAAPRGLGSLASAAATAAVHHHNHSHNHSCISTAMDCSAAARRGVASWSANAAMHHSATTACAARSPAQTPTPLPRARALQQPALVRLPCTADTRAGRRWSSTLSTSAPSDARPPTTTPRDKLMEHQDMETLDDADFYSSGADEHLEAHGHEHPAAAAATPRAQQNLSEDMMDDDFAGYPNQSDPVVDQALMDSQSSPRDRSSQRDPADSGRKRATDEYLARRSESTTSRRRSSRASSEYAAAWAERFKAARELKEAQRQAETDLAMEVEARRRVQLASSLSLTPQHDYLGIESRKMIAEQAFEERELSVEGSLGLADVHAHQRLAFKRLDPSTSSRRLRKRSASRGPDVDPEAALQQFGEAVVSIRQHAELEHAAAVLEAQRVQQVLQEQQQLEQQRRHAHSELTPQQAMQESAHDHQFPESSKRLPSELLVTWLDQYSPEALDLQEKAKASELMLASLNKGSPMDAIPSSSYSSSSSYYSSPFNAVPEEDGALLSDITPDQRLRLARKLERTRQAQYAESSLASGRAAALACDKRPAGVEVQVRAPFYYGPNSLIRQIRDSSQRRLSVLSVQNTSFGSVWKIVLQFCQPELWQTRQLMTSLAPLTTLTITPLNTLELLQHKQAANTSVAALEVGHLPVSVSALDLQSFFGHFALAPEVPIEIRRTADDSRAKIRFANASEATLAHAWAAGRVWPTSQARLGVRLV